MTTNHPIPAIARGYEDIYHRFIQGKLIYKPNEESTVGMIEIPFSSLPNPLEGTFDLSQFGDIGEKMKISTGYKKSTNDDEFTTEVWIVPRFVIERELSGPANYFTEVMGEFTAPVAVYWTLGSDECKIYNTSGCMYNRPHFGKNGVYNLETSMEELSSCNLIGHIYDTTMSPYDMFKPKEQRNMVRSRSCLSPSHRGQAVPKIYVQFP